MIVQRFIVFFTMFFSVLIFETNAQTDVSAGRIQQHAQQIVAEGNVLAKLNGFEVKLS